MIRNITVFSLLALLAVALIGCGGGGGGSSSSDDNNNDTTGKYVLTGTVLVNGTTTPIVGAKITVGSTVVQTDSSGKFKMVLSTVPVVTTYSVNGKTATPGEGYFDFWAKISGTVYNAKAIPLPLAPKTGQNLGTIYLISYSETPPPPVL
ncbi:MAG: hypothetical protein ABFD64_11660 [Armatimonadota bacterium]